jgi:nucleotide-binding universal stress UspA family protein
MAFPDLSKLLKMEKQIWKTRKRAGGKLLTNLQHKLRKRGNVTKTNMVLTKGHAAEAIIEKANQIQADLIVVGSRGLTGIKRLFLGSVSRKVVRHAPCSVLVVRQSKTKYANPGLGSWPKPIKRSVIQKHEHLKYQY